MLSVIGTHDAHIHAQGGLCPSQSLHVGFNTTRRWRIIFAEMANL
jgi:hypothetical protein